MRAHEHSKGRRRHRVWGRGEVIIRSESLLIPAFLIHFTICKHQHVLSLLFSVPINLTGVYRCIFSFTFKLQTQLGENFGKGRELHCLDVDSSQSFCFGCLNFPDTNLDRDSLFAMPGRWNLLILGESHLSSICAVVRMENHLLRKFENALCLKEGNWLAAVGWKLLRIDIYILF